MQDNPVNVVTHSYGALVFAEMQRIATERGWTCFVDTDVVMTAPAGFKDNEQYLPFLRRFLQQSGIEKNSSKAFPDQDKVIEKASHESLLANLGRSALEVREVMNKCVDLKTIHELGSRSITVLGFAEDALYGHQELADELQKYIGTEAVYDIPVSYANPYSLDETEAGVLYGKDDSTHGDDTHNPRRVMMAVSQILHR